MSSDGNKALVVRYLRAALAAARSGDFAGADELVADDAEFHQSRSASSARSAHQQRWQELVTAFADLEFDVHDLIGVGDRVIVRWAMRGIHGGVFAGVLATGRELATAGITIYRIGGGKIVEAWSIHDELGMLEQLGVVIERVDGDDDDVDPEAELGMIV